MDNNTNGIACLVICLFSIIANSAAMECNFSNFGNIQTKKCSLLLVANTHKINIVHMDIYCHHVTLALLKTHSKRKLGDDDKPTCTTDDVPSDAEDNNFESLAQNLIDMAIADKAANIVNEEEELLALSCVVIPPNQQRAAHHTCTQIPLASLFWFYKIWQWPQCLSARGYQGFECRGWCLWVCICWAGGLPSGPRCDGGFFIFLIPAVNNHYFRHWYTISTSYTIFYYIYVYNSSLTYIITLQSHVTIHTMHVWIQIHCELWISWWRLRSSDSLHWWVSQSLTLQPPLTQHIDRWVWPRSSPTLVVGNTHHGYSFGRYGYGVGKMYLQYTHMKP